MPLFTSRLDLALDVAQSYLGTFYSWGGDDPSGFDCSGLMIEILKSVGILPRKGDWTADGLKDKFNDKSIQVPRAGCLLFWGVGGKAVHVEMVFAIFGNDVITIGASGGGSKTTSKEVAIQQNAFVKIRKARDGWFKCVNPFMGVE